MRASSIAAVSDHRPHDLLWVDDASALITVGARPVWATTSWLRAAPVVVRRAPMLSAHRVPVGLRGLTRSERCAAHVGADCVTHKVTPEDVARRLVIVASLRDSPPTCLRMLARLAPAFDESALCWGVTGSVGFTLASGCDVLHSESDLDLLVRAPHPGDVDGLRAVAARVRDAGPLVDVQVETPCGAFALKEWSRTGGPVMLKTALGPVLCEDPWHAEYPPSRAAGAPVTA